MNGEDLNKESFYKKGLSRFQHGYHEEALKIINNLLLLDPNYSEALELKNKIEKKLGLKAMRTASSASEVGLDGDREKLFEFIKKGSSGKVLKYLFGFSAEESNSEFYTFVGKALQLNPKFFLESIYTPFRRKLRKIYGNEKRRGMERTILEKNCLYDTEKIIYECQGPIEMHLKYHYKLKVDGDLFFTNQRIIAEGIIHSKLKSRPPFLSPPTAKEIARDILLPEFTSTERKDHIDAKNEMIYYSIRDLPCYGYIFPIKKLYNLIMKKRAITYNVKKATDEFDIKISSRQPLDELYEILDKNQS
jgi:hypothetical protein